MWSHGILSLLYGVVCGFGLLLVGRDSTFILRYSTYYSTRRILRTFQYQESGLPQAWKFNPTHIILHHASPNVIQHHVGDLYKLNKPLRAWSSSLHCHSAAKRVCFHSYSVVLLL
jgi:hypothetical protein